MSREKLTFKALVVLDEALAAARKGPVAGSPGVRMALAYLYASARRPDRSMYDDFYRKMQLAHASSHSDNIGNTWRSNDLTSLMHGICRNAGLEQTSEVMGRLFAARLDKNEREAHLRRAFYFSQNGKLLLEDLRTPEQKASAETEIAIG